jgi:hypothetical protein
MHYMQRTHLLLSLLIATVFPGHFAEASVMHFKMVGGQGLEPRMPMAPDLQSGAVTCSARHPRCFLVIVVIIVTACHLPPTRHHKNSRIANAR